MTRRDDSRVSTESDQDANMEDSEARGSPPGDPPDVTGSWMSKVKGSSAGGMPIPEDVLDEEFVAARLQLEFPNGEDGEPVITIGEEVLEAMNGMWKQCMIVKVLGRNVSIAVLNRKLREMWKPKGEMYVMDLPRQFFMIRFELEEEYMAAFTGGPWRAFGSYLMVKAWSPEFDPIKDEIVTTPVWVRISNIPVNFYHKSILMGVARGLGRPIKVDGTTLNFERARFARVCVEVDLKRPLKGSLMINGERYFVSYEGLTNICSMCGLYGHLVHTCPRGGTKRDTSIPMQRLTMTESGNERGQGEDGFTPVRQSRRSSGGARRKENLEVGPVREGMVTNRRDLRKESDMARLSITNRFGSLEEDIGSLEVRDDINCHEEDKENQNVSNQINGRSETQAKGIVFGAGLMKGPRGNTNGPRDGNKPKKNTNGKGPESYTTRPKQSKVGKPARGLIFGPTKGEVELSANGKRLRVEKENLGRSGGYFVTEEQGEEGSLGRVIEKTSPSTNGEVSEASKNTYLVMHGVPLERPTETHNA